MADQKNHSFTSSSKIRSLSFQGLLFLLPVAIIYLVMEHKLTEVRFPEAVKMEFINENAEEVEILLLGSSQVQRAVNPEHLSKPAINLANQSQMLYEDLQLLKYFRPELNNLKVVVFEVSYDKLERDKSYTSPVLHHKNLKFYGVNTFGRPLKFQDNFLFHSNPDYFYGELKDHLSNSSGIRLNKYGFDVNKYDGIYRNANYQDEQLKDENILIENISNEEIYKKNLLVLHEIIQFCLRENLQILIYHPPTHRRYNKLIDPQLLNKWNSLISDLRKTYDDVHFFIDYNNPDFEMNDFYNGNHLNPDGAKKASENLDAVINQKFY